MNFPGGIVKFTPELKFLSDVPEERIHCYRVLDESGQLLTSDFVEVCCLTMCVSHLKFVTLSPLSRIFMFIDVIR